MPYNGINDSKLPSYVKSRTEPVRRRWISIFNAIYKESGEEKAFVAANTWLKKQAKKKVIMAKTQNTVERIVFELDMADGQFLKKSEAGEEYIDFVLSDDKKDMKGNQFDIKVLEKMAEQINNGDVVIGDIDHREYDRIMQGFYSDEETIKLLKNKPGIAKAVKAIIQQGKLWVRAFIDKRYSKLVREKAKGVSLEGLFRTRDDGRVIDGTLTGFTFAINNPQVNPRAVVA